MILVLSTTNTGRTAGAKVFAACNEITRLSKPLQSRFRCLHLPRYTEDQFLEVSVKVLPKLKIAHMIGRTVWGQRGDIRDVISIGKLVRKNDGPEEVEQILDWESMEESIITITTVHLGLTRKFKRKWSIIIPLVWALVGLSTIQSVYAHTGWAYWVASDQISPSSFGISQADDRSLPKAAWDGLTTYWPDLRWTIWIEKYCDICVKKIK